MSIPRRVLRWAGGPLRRYLDMRFDRIEETLRVRHEDLLRAEALARIDVSRHNRIGRAPTFEQPVSQVVSSAQFESEAFRRWLRVFRSVEDEGARAHWSVTERHRKEWEWAYILRNAELHDVLRAGRSAVGFGVGHELLPAALASQGVRVLATDRDPAASGEWAATSQHMGGVEELRHPSIVDDGTFEALVRTRFVDMNHVPDDLGTFDLVWSAGSFEHLGSPEAGLAFVLRSLDLLAPGGLAVHTTELDLVPRPQAVDYGHLAAYQPDDLDALVEGVRARGFEIEPNWYVSLERPEDRWISINPDVRSPDTPRERAHLKLAIFDSVLTSVGIVVRKPVSQP